MSNRIIIKISIIVERIIYYLKKTKHFIEGIEDYSELDKKKIVRKNSKKVVVFSCITGNYDTIKKPFMKLPNVDYIMFTDRENNINNGWINKKIPNEISKFTNANINRYIKMHPHDLFYKEYDYAIYIDGKIKIFTDLHPLISFINKKTGLALYRHGRRTNVYDEADQLISMGKGNRDNIINQMRNYKLEKLPKDTGLFEMAIIVTDLKNKTAKNLLTSWWDEFISSNSDRDQISWPYVLWKHGYSKDDIGDLGNNYEGEPKWITKGH